jgi:oligoendopeptidase F
MYRAHIELKNTLCSTLNGHIKSDIFRMKTRKYKSCIEHSLFGENVDITVYNSLIEAVH